MKFPLRLTLDLWRGQLFSGANNSAGSGPIFHLPAALLPTLHENGLAHGPESDLHTAADSLRTAAKTKAPVLWIGGSEPLDHAEVGRVAFALNAKGRNVFLHTNGERLRQRIHEFRPDPRLFLTVEFAGREEIHDANAARPGAFGRAIEGIRAAKLSGFYVCAHVTVKEETNPCDIGELFEFLDRYDVDGYIASANGQSVRAEATALADKLQEARELVRCPRWENFSRNLEAAFASSVQKTEQVIAGGPGAGDEAHAVSDAVEETV